MPKPMREVSKKTPKEGGDGPPSSHKSEIKEGKGHKQTGGAKKVAADDMIQQKKNQKKQPVDPFKQMMADATRNSRYSLPLEMQGTIDPGDPMNVSPMEHDNAPKIVRR